MEAELQRPRYYAVAFLSYSQLIILLKLLTERDLLSYDLNSLTLKTAEKGLKFLEIYNQMSDVMKMHRQQHHDQLSELR